MDKNNYEINLFSIVIDCKNPSALANFYASFLGWNKNCDDPEWICVSKENVYPIILFQENPNYVAPVWPDKQGEQQKSIHLDFGVNDVDKVIEYATVLGAKKADVQFSDNWTVMLDPEGHPFCIFKR